MAKLVHVVVTDELWQNIALCLVCNFVYGNLIVKFFGG